MEKWHSHDRYHSRKRNKSTGHREQKAIRRPQYRFTHRTILAKKQLAAEIMKDTARQRFEGLLVVNDELLDKLLRDDDVHHVERNIAVQIQTHGDKPMIPSR